MSILDDLKPGQVWRFKRIRGFSCEGLLVTLWRDEQGMPFQAHFSCPVLPSTSLQVLQVYRKDVRSWPGQPLTPSLEELLETGQAQLS